MVFFSLRQFQQTYEMGSWNLLKLRAVEGHSINCLLRLVVNLSPFDGTSRSLGTVVICLSNRPSEKEWKWNDRHSSEHRSWVRRKGAQTRRWHRFLRDNCQHSLYRQASMYHKFSYAWRLHPNTRNQAKGMLEELLLAVELRIWFESTRSTFLSIHWYFPVNNLSTLRTKIRLKDKMRRCQK